MCSSGSKNPRIFGGLAPLTAGCRDSNLLDELHDRSKKRPGYLAPTPLSAYGRKESRPRTEWPSERRAFCTIREREAKLSGRARTTFGFGDQIWSLTRHDSL